MLSPLLTKKCNQFCFSRVMIKACTLTRVWAFFCTTIFTRSPMFSSQSRLTRGWVLLPLPRLDNVMNTISMLRRNIHTVLTAITPAGARCCNWRILHVQLASSPHTGLSAITATAAKKNCTKRHLAAAAVTAPSPV